MPDLVMMNLPNDHTQGLNADWCTPKACVADNDLALGQIVEGLSHSSVLEGRWRSWWLRMTRRTAWITSTVIARWRWSRALYARRGVDRQHVLQPAEHGEDHRVDARAAGAVSMFDLVATDMRASFLDPSAEPDLSPSRRSSRSSHCSTRTNGWELTGPTAAARRQARSRRHGCDFDGPDAAPIRGSSIGSCGTTRRGGRRPIRWRASLSSSRCRWISPTRIGMRSRCRRRKSRAGSANATIPCRASVGIVLRLDTGQGAVFPSHHRRSRRNRQWIPNCGSRRQRGQCG